MAGPTRAELDAARHRRVRDVIAPDLRVVFCGINPGLYSAWTGHHFAKAGNRFWPVLHLSGFTPRILAPSEKHEMLGLGLGVTNVVMRATATAAELSPEELVAGGRRLVAKMNRYRPRFLAILGIGAYRSAFGRPKAVIGLQSESIGNTQLWVLPNPSGLNANYQKDELSRLFGELRVASDA